MNIGLSTIDFNTTKVAIIEATNLPVSGKYMKCLYCVLFQCSKIVEINSIGSLN